jgi:predicted secreted protein
MTITSALAIYFIIWWLVLFAVLPFGVRNAEEAGEKVEQGHDAGAPAVHGIGWKAKVTTLIASVLFVPLYIFLASGGLEKLSGLIGAPSL